MPAAAAPFSDGGVFRKLCPKVELWSQGAHPDLTIKASTLVLHMDPTACKVCGAVGDEKLSGRGHGAKIPEVLRDLFAQKNPSILFTERLCDLRASSVAPSHWANIRYGSLPLVAKLSRGCNLAVSSPKLLSRSCVSRTHPCPAKMKHWC